jgi:hypothetical protein
MPRVFLSHTLILSGCCDPRYVQSARGGVPAINGNFPSGDEGTAAGLTEVMDWCRKVKEIDQIWMEKYCAQH